MWTSRLFWKLFLTYAGWNLAWAAVFAFVVSGWYAEQVDQHVQRRLRDAALLVRIQVADQLARGRTPELQTRVHEIRRLTDIRITLVALDGTVLADSEQDTLAQVARMGNHRSRPELRQAAESGQGRAERRSPTLDAPMQYLAHRIDRDGQPVGFVRVAIPMASTHAEIAQIRRLIWLLAALVTVSVVVLTYWVATRIIRPITSLTAAAQAVAKGDYHQHVTLSQRDELADLAHAFNEMSQQLAGHVGQLRTSRELLSTVLESMSEGVIAADEQPRILFANSAAAQMLGFQADSAQGRRLADVLRHHVLYDVVGQTLADASVHHCELESAGSSDRILSVHSSPLPGQPCPGVVLVLRDVTELRRLESLRRDFVANVSHELKTPLTSIKAYAETLSQGALEDPHIRVHFVQQIEDQAERLHQLILDVLSLNRIESGRQVFNIQTVSLAKAVQCCLERQQASAQAKGVSLRTEPPPAPLCVRADDEGVCEILENLVDNAIKYTPSGGQVTVRWRREDSMGLIEVQDDGIGIAAQHHARLWERFYRVDVARSRELGGTGLGLSIVKHLALFFGGSVGVRSAPGAGSTFSVKLPLQ